MTAEPVQSPRKSSIDFKPLLPTYEQHQSTGIETKISPPEETATAHDIRAFLIQLLISERGLTPDYAHDVASKWTIGNGKELRAYPPAMYLDIFGRECGWVVYKETKLCIGRDEKDTDKFNVPPFWLRCIYSALCLAAMIGVCYGFAWGIQKDILIASVTSGVLFWVVAVLCVACALSFAESEYTESRIERELQDYFKTCGTHRSHGMDD